MAADDEEDYEAELGQQIDEQKTALGEINEALQLEPSDELLEVKAQLEEAVKELEQSLFEVKKAKLLRTLESMTGVCATGVTVTAQPALTSEPAAAATFSSRVPPGAACR